MWRVETFITVGYGAVLFPMPHLGDAIGISLLHVNSIVRCGTWGTGPCDFVSFLAIRPSSGSMVMMSYRPSPLKDMWTKEAKVEPRHAHQKTSKLKRSSAPARVCTQISRGSAPP